MRIRQTEVMVTPAGTTRYPAGAVLIADEETANRWYENSIADIAPPDAEAYGEVTRRLKREEFQRKAQAVEEGSFDQAISRGNFQQDDYEPGQLMPRPMPVPDRRGPGRPRKELGGAVINDRMDDDGDN
jgi:hypothetical protein